jgi:hypothetical protein
MKLITTALICCLFIGYIWGSLIASGQATDNMTNELKQNLVNKILNSGTQIISNTTITVNPKVSYQYHDNTEAFLQQINTLNIKEVYVTGNEKDGYNFKGFTSDWSTGVSCYTPRQLVWQWWRF